MTVSAGGELYRPRQPALSALEKYNPRHEPAGSSTGGEFASSGGYSEAQREALGAYVEALPYGNVKDRISFIEIRRYMQTAVGSERLKGVVRQLQSALDRPLRDGRVLWRGGVFKDVRGFLPGRTFRDKSFMSMTTHRTVAQGFTETGPRESRTPDRKSVV